MPETTGTTVFTGGAAATTPVTTETADELPAAFVPVTFDRSVLPTSAATAVYVDDVAPARSTQLAPAALQRCHWYVYVIVGVPVHVPVVDDSARPSRAVPETTGTTVFTGGAAATTPVTTETAEELPAAFVPVTFDRSVLPTSAATAVYVDDVAPARSAQLAPAALQRCHWYV